MSSGLSMFKNNTIIGINYNQNKCFIESHAPALFNEWPMTQHRVPNACLILLFFHGKLIMQDKKKCRKYIGLRVSKE